MHYNQSDEDIFEEIKKGNDKAFKKLFDCYYIPLCRTANLFVNSPEASEEIVQDIFVHIWENREQTNITVSVKSYLYSSVRNRSINYMRDQKRFESVELLEELTGSENDGNAILELKELEELFAAAIESLPEKCKRIIQMSREENLSVKEIAEREGISPKTVENQITIGLKKIRLFIQEYYFIITLISFLK